MVALVTVVIPAYNPGDMLGEALESVHRQTFDDWDVVVVDDGSREPLRPVVEQFPRATVLRQPNSGASVARNRGILWSRSPFVALLDQDDLWTTTKLQHQVDVLTQHPHVGLAFCDVRVIGRAANAEWLRDDPARPVEGRVLFSPSDLEHPATGLRHSLQHFGEAFVVPSSILYRRECLAVSGLLNPWRPFTGDYDLLIRVAAGHNAAHVASPDVLYRRHDSNFTAQYDVGRRETARMRAEYVDHARQAGDRDLEATARAVLRRDRALYAAQAFDCARQAWRGRHLSSTAYHLGRSALFDPRVLAAAARTRRPAAHAAGGPSARD
jgi:glycosyltransferase involved in cell wall biosynthesis